MLIGACTVLENYLDGAIADYENGNIDIYSLSFIEDCIAALKKLGDASNEKYRKKLNELKKGGIENESKNN